MVLIFISIPTPKSLQHVVFGHCKACFGLISSALWSVGFPFKFKVQIIVQESTKLARVRVEGRATHTAFCRLWSTIRTANPHKMLSYLLITTVRLDTGFGFGFGFGCPERSAGLDRAVGIRIRPQRLDILHHPPPNVVLRTVGGQEYVDCW